MIGMREAVERRDKMARQANGLEQQAVALKAEVMRLESERRRLSAEVSTLGREKTKLGASVYAEKERLGDLQREVEHIDPEAHAARNRAAWDERYPMGAVA